MSSTPGRRTRVLALVGVVLVGLLVGGLVLRHARHKDQMRATDASLARTGQQLEGQLRTFNRLRHAFPVEVRLKPHASVLVGATPDKSLGNSTYVGKGTVLAWYRNYPDPRITYPGYRDDPGYSFCLSQGGRHWRTSANDTVVTTQPDVPGPCLAPARRGSNPALP